MASDSWPPPAVAPFVGDWSKWAAWWASDTEKLDANAPQPTNAPQQSKRNGGRFWSRQQSAQSAPARNLLHVPLAADIAQTSADLLFGDQPKFYIPKGEVGSDKVQGRLDNLFHEAALLNDFHFGAEMCAAIGGSYLRPVWNENIAERPLLTVVGADQALPELWNGILRAVTFWDELPKLDEADATVWRHLERHERGRIRHTLHMGTAERLGLAVPYQEHPALDWLVDLAAQGKLTDGDSISTEKINKRGLLVSYAPNAQSRRNRKPGVGRADIDGSEGLLDALDETWTSWMRDLRLGRARIVVDEQALTGVSQGPGRPTIPTRGFDIDQEVFSPLPGTAGFGADGPLKPVQFAIRVEEHHRTAQALIEQIVTDCGYAPQTFGIHAEGALSGTAHRLRELRTHRTEGRKQRLWGPAAEHATHMLLAIGREVFGWEAEVRPSIEWAETDADEPLQRAQTIEVLARARALSIETAVRMAQPQLDDIAVGKEVERIKGDDGISDGDVVPVDANLP